MIRMVLDGGFLFVLRRVRKFPESDLCQPVVAFFAARSQSIVFGSILVE